MSFTISKEFEFSASHQLSGLPEGHQCSRNHGHNYKVTLHLKADKTNAHGFIRDYGELSVFKEWLDEHFEHRLLNDITEFNPTAENLALHLFTVARRLGIEECIGVTVKETDKTSANYTFDGRMV